MKIAIGSDHRGTDLRRVVVEFLVNEGHEVNDVGVNDKNAIDYPDIAADVARMISFQTVHRGILICGTGVGMCVVANKFHGVRATPCSNDITAELSRRHNDANVLCLSGDMLGERACLSLIRKWLTTDFEGGRHQVRLAKILNIEKELDSKHGEMSRNTLAR